jgi:hypothetical protein
MNDLKRLDKLFKWELVIILGELQITSHEDQLFEQLKIHLLLNLSKCYRKMGDFDGAADSAGEVKT